VRADTPTTPGDSMEDSDIKIYGRDPRACGTGEMDLAECVNRFRSDGSFKKAKQLGAALAETVSREPCGFDLPQEVQPLCEDEHTASQMKVLLVFCIQTALHRELPHQILSAEAVNEFYDCLMRLSPALYESLADGAAFTFYYLAVKDSQDIAASAGSQFAMLCGKEDSPVYTRAGRMLYDAFTARAEAAVEKAGFTGA